MKINKSISLFLLLILLSSCHTLFNPSMLQVQKKPLPVLLKNMEISKPAELVNNTKTVTVSTPVFTLFERNLETNWMEIDSNIKYGRIEIIQISTNSKIPLLFPILTGLSFYTFNLLGMPIFTQTFSVEYDINIFDVNGKRIKKYNHFGSSKNTYGFYYGRKGFVVEIDAIKEVIKQLDDDLMHDSNEINEKLESAFNNKIMK